MDGGAVMAIDALQDITDERREDGRLVRLVRVRPEFDCWDRCAHGQDTCKPHTGGWHGIGSRRIIWSVAVLGKGGVSLELSTPIYTENALLRGGSGLRSIVADWSPLGPLHLHYGSDPGHALAGPTTCPLIDGECWGDVTYLAVDEGWERFKEGGTPAVWAWLGEKWLPDAMGAAITSAGDAS